MKMVKSLLLGSAAGLVAVVGAQAADLPVKAKPVEYVKVCSLYGAGFYYIPGTDICMKMGGYVRAQYYYGTGNGGAVSNGIMFGQANSQQTALQGQTHDADLRTRAIWTVDTRSQTEWGTLRTYVLMGYTQDSTGSAFPNNTAASLYATRGFIQFAGFTFGKAQSFYDIYSTPAVSYFGIAASDTGDSGVLLASYTAQFGNGVSATLAVEDPRRAGIAAPVSFFGVATTTNPFLVGSSPTNNDYANVTWPDVVANLRVDQAWGSFQVMGAVHDASAGYYTDAAGLPLDVFGRPGSQVGFAVGAGAVINTDFISRGDKFQFQVNYTEGALRYAMFTPTGVGSLGRFGGGNTLGVGFLNDATVTGGALGSVELTKVLGINASYDHLWTPSLKTSVYGGYFQVNYSDAANATMCTQLVAANKTAGSISSLKGVCDNDFNYWYIGSRTQWNVRPDFYMGVDVLYHKLESASAGSTVTFTQLGTGGRTSGTYTLADQDAVSVTFRVHRDIVP